jgi:hypothetical protein
MGLAEGTTATTANAALTNTVRLALAALVKSHRWARGLAATEITTRQLPVLQLNTVRSPQFLLSFIHSIELLENFLPIRPGYAGVP